jgi:hypothetical protein
VPAVQQRVVAAQAERGPCRRAGDAVGRQAMGALEVLQRALRAWAEDAVGGDAEPALQQPDCAAARAAGMRG